MHALSILVLVVGMLPATGALPPITRSIEIYNDSKLPLDAFEVRRAGAGPWSTNLLPSPIPAITVKSYQITLMQSICMYDVQFVLRDGTTSQVFGVDLCGESPIIVDWRESTTDMDEEE